MPTTVTAVIRQAGSEFLFIQIAEISWVVEDFEEFLSCWDVACLNYSNLFVHARAFNLYCEAS